ncbi:MAG: iron-sulfur cluster assembly protein [Myxococcota bacterium]
MTEIQTDTTPSDGGDLKEAVVAALKSCYDPEIPVDIYELGLIYEIDIREGNVAYLKMTLTSPMCPVAEILPLEVQEKVAAVPAIARCELDLVWDPPWDMEMMSEAAKLELNF